MILARASGPFQAVRITPDPARVRPGGKLRLHAHVAGLSAQHVVWHAPRGNGTISGSGLYTAPKTPGDYEVTAARHAAGLSPGAFGLASVQVGYQPPGPPTRVTAASGKTGTATIRWKAPADTGGAPLTGYTVTTMPGWEQYPVAAAATGITISGLAPGDSYTFTVAATGPGGDSVPSAPAGPVKVSGTPRASGTWTSPAEADPVESTDGLPLVYPGLSCVGQDWCMTASPFGIWVYPSGLGQSPYRVGFTLSRGYDYPTYISCASRGFCMLAQAQQAATWRNGKLAQRQVIPATSNGTFTTVSCASTAFCAAGTNTGHLYTWRSGTWRPAAAVFPGYVAGLSCASASYCVAVSADAASVWLGQSWSTPVKLGISDADSVSCPSAGWCQVTGAGGEVLPFTAGTPGPAHQLGTANMTAVSCTSASFCVTAAYTGGNTAVFYAWNGTSWNGGVTDDGFLGYSLTLSCASASYCAAIDAYGVGADSPAPAQAWNGPAFDMQSGNIGSISCASATQCAASDFPGNELTWSGSGWSFPQYVGVVLGPTVSCPDASFCASMSYGYFETWTPAAGWTGKSTALPSGADAVACASDRFCATYNAGSVYLWHGSSWSAAYRVDPAKELDSIACVSATWCMAASGTGKLYRWNGKSWPAVGAISGDAGNNVLLSCPTAGFCVAGTGNGLTATWNGSAWRAGPKFTGGPQITALSCVSSSYCVAALTGGPGAFVSTWLGAGWTAPRLVDPDNSITALSCPSTSFCAAGDWTGEMLEFSTSAVAAVAPGVAHGAGSPNGQPARRVAPGRLPRR